jgi:hypothetical protein
VPGPPISSSNKTDHNEITEILLKVALNIIKQNVLETLLDTCTNEKYKLAMKIALRTSGLRGNIKDDDLLLVLIFKL